MAQEQLVTLRKGKRLGQPLNWSFSVTILQGVTRSVLQINNPNRVMSSEIINMDRMSVMKKNQQPFLVSIFFLLVFSHAALADTYSCQRSNGIRFQSSNACPSDSQTLVVIKDKAILAPDYAADAKQKADAQRERGYVYQNPVDATRQQARPTSEMQPRNDHIYAAQRKEQSCDANWESIRLIDQAARTNSTEGLRNERKRLMDERWSLGC